MAVFAQRGYAAAKLEDIASAAGIGKGTIYLYFPAKEDLFRAVVRQKLLPNLDQIDAMIAAHEGSSADLLRLIANRLLQLAATDLTAIPKLVLTEAGNFPTIARFYATVVVRRGMRLLGTVIERGVERREFRHIDARQVAPIFIAPFLLIMLWKHSLGQHAGPIFDPPSLIETHLNLLLSALAADRDP
ncbi:MAG: helix-turn-helix transcriptional regulator [Acetobacteraceae bacterium]|nr:helix-turn-helix transcriptional regulator [Acetobacteraceae bacterium]